MARLGVSTDSPTIRARIALATDFFKRHAISFDFLKGIDYSQEVSEITLNPGVHLIAYRAGPLPGAASWNPFGLFYTEVGTSSYEVGIKPDPRMFVRYIVAKAAKALKSRPASLGVAGACGQGPRYLAAGGGWQYVVPGAVEVLRRI